MKKVLGIMVALAIFCCLPMASSATEAEMKGKGATMHDIIVSTAPSNVEIIAPYKKSIKLHRLKTDEVAYWFPEGGKYITAGKYSYVWCRIYKKGKAKSSYHWIAVDSRALFKAMRVGHQYKGGVAFYQLTYDGQKIYFKDYLYSTLHAMATGEKVITVRE